MDAFKECPSCKETKPASAFWKNAGSRSGLAHYCKVCFSARQASKYRQRAAGEGRAVRDPRRGPDGTKWCPDCDDYRPTARFAVNAGRYDGLAGYCKQHQQERIDGSRKKVHGSTRHYHLMHRYGIGAQQVEELIAAQGGLCGICSREVGDKPHVDHDHETGAVRGILCFNCNGGLGQFGDDVTRLEQAIEYLKGGRTPAAQAARAAEQRLLELIDRYGRAA